MESSKLFSEGRPEAPSESRPTDVLAEVNTERNAVDVHKDCIGTEMRREAIENPASYGSSIRATVGYE